jgi:hypothetical protein
MHRSCSSVATDTPRPTQGKRPAGYLDEFRRPVWSAHMYSPAPVDEPVDAIINTIFDAARRDRLIVCAGAGLSRALPTDLPSGAVLGQLLDERLRSLVAGYAPPMNPENLIAVADAGALLDGGEDALRSEVLKLARFLEADPNYGHQILAELLCEGGIELLLLWNWDDCIERVDVVPERLQVARSRDDLQQLNQPSIAKVHGCATRKGTLLITSNDLDTPPLWTEDAFGERVRDKTVIFIGVGDIADYAQRRLRELRDYFVERARAGEPSLDIWVIGPSIRSRWDGSEWATLMPDLPEERRVQFSADQFLDQLGRRWVREAFDDLELSAETSIRAEVMASLRKINKELGSIGAARAMRWCRRAALGQKVGRSVILCDGLKEALAAFAVLLSDHEDEPVKVLGPAAFKIGDRRIEALIACETVAADRVRDRAQRRAGELANDGVVSESATFLVAGTVLGPLDDDPESELDLASGPIDPEDIAVGSDGVRLSFMRASDMVQAA